MVLSPAAKDFLESLVITMGVDGESILESRKQVYEATKAGTRKGGQEAYEIGILVTKCGEIHRMQ